MKRDEVKNNSTRDVVKYFLYKIRNDLFSMESKRIVHLISNIHTDEI